MCAVSWWPRPRRLMLSLNVGASLVSMNWLFFQMAYSDFPLYARARTAILFESPESSVTCLLKMFSRFTVPLLLFGVVNP